MTTIAYVLNTFSLMCSKFFSFTPLAKYCFTVYYMSDTLLIVQETANNKLDMIPAVMELY